MNTSDNDVYHKGLHLYGADLARAHAARAGQVILCEGYTDVIALHQAGLSSAVGLMGTALTNEQVGELARMASTVLLALDADTAGQEAMLRASRLAARRNLELRVVTLPGGMDPAELIQQGGAARMAVAVRESVPFVRFRVERVLANGDHSSPEGRDRMIDELRPVFDTMQPSAMRMELTRLVAGRLELPDSLAETLLAGGAGARAPGTARPGAHSLETRSPGTPSARAGALPRREETERTFLALCIAMPQEGARALEALDPDEHFTSERLRRAAAHLRAGRLAEPMAEIDEEDEGGGHRVDRGVGRAGRAGRPRIPGADDAGGPADAVGAGPPGPPHPRCHRAGRRRGQRARPPPRRRQARLRAGL